MTVIVTLEIRPCVQIIDYCVIQLKSVNEKLYMYFILNSWFTPQISVLFKYIFIDLVDRYQSILGLCNYESLLH